MQSYLFTFMPVVMPAGSLCTLAGKTKTEFQIWQDDGLCATHLGNSSAMLCHSATGVGSNPRGDARVTRIVSAENADSTETA